MEEGCPARASLSFCPPLDRTGQGGGGGEQEKIPGGQNLRRLFLYIKTWSLNPAPTLWAGFDSNLQIKVVSSCQLVVVAGQPGTGKCDVCFFYNLHLPSLRNTSSLSIYSTTLGETVYSPDLALYWKSGFSIIILELGLTVPNLV